MIYNEHEIKYVVCKYMFIHFDVRYCNFCIVKINDRNKI